MKLFMLFVALMLTISCGGGGGSSKKDETRLSLHCSSQPHAELMSIPEQFEDNYSIVLDGCNIKIRNLDNNCTRYGRLETNPYPNFGADLTVDNKINCSDNYPNDQRCTIYKNVNNETFFGCQGLGIDAYFTEI